MSDTKPTETPENCRTAAHKETLKAWLVDHDKPPVMPKPATEENKS